jgi:hypothetical protein
MTIKAARAGDTGACKHPLYKCWRDMRSRCFMVTHQHYHRYGGRGITICPDWDHFWTFVFDMGPRPAGHTLDRINNNGNYEPANCRWATWLQQSHNSTCVRMVRVGNESMCISELARKLGAPLSTVSSVVLNRKRRKRPPSVKARNILAAIGELPEREGGGR